MPQPATTVLSDRDEVARRLHAMSLGVDDFTEAILRGDMEARSCTPFEPTTAPGWSRYSKTVGALRERLVSRGWEIDDDRNWPRVVHPSGSFALSVATGNELTGDPDPRVKPSTRYPRGPATRDAVRTNHEQLSFAMVDDLVRAGVPGISRHGRVTYMLLICAQGDTIRAEVSCPSAFADDGRRPVDWSERIILPEIEGGSDVPRTLPAPTPIDVDVRRRSAS